MAVGSLSSPMWALLTLVMKPYVDLQSVLASNNLLGSYIDLIIKLKQSGAAHLLFHLIPLILLCGAVGILYCYAWNIAGLHMTRYLMNRFRPKAST